MKNFDFIDGLQALAEADTPDLPTLDRVEQRVLQSTRRPLRQTRRRATRWWIAGAAALAAAALLAVQVWPGDRSLAEPQILGDGVVTLDDGVTAEIQGRGSSLRGSDATTVTWVEGSITLDVDPTSVGAVGREVQIRTDEALVRVLGTVLTVRRGSFGTEVSVDRGKVETTCMAASAPPEPLLAGERALCLRDAGAGLGYLLLLERQRAPAVERLEVVDRALGYPGALAETYLQLREHRIQVLAELGRHLEAIQETSFLPATERIGRLSTGATEAMSAGGCTQADPWLIALAEAGQATGALLRVQCLADEQPEAARAVLEGIDEAALTPAQADTVQRWERVLR